MAVLSKDYWMVAKHVDLQPLADSLSRNVLRASELNKLISSFDKRDITFDFIGLKVYIDYIKKVVIEKLQQVAPSIRIKRGILNPLGSLIKVITGNLDNDDAIRYDKMINEVKLNQNNYNKKLTLITEIAQNLANSTIKLDKNIIQIDTILRKLNNNITEVLKMEYNNHIEIQIINAYHLLIHNFQSIRIKLNEIETSLALSRLGILHQSVIESDNLMKLLEKINKVEKLVFPPTLENLAKIEQTVTLKVFLKGNQITFLLEIPLVERNTYIYYKLLPLPVLSQNRTVIIIPKYPYILAKGRKIIILTRPCQEIDESSYLCLRDDMSQYLQDHCITELMTYAENVTSCTQIPVSIGALKLDLIKINRWILYSGDTTLLTRTCTNEIFRQKIHGTYIITLNDPCEVKIGNISLKMHTIEFQNSIMDKMPIVDLPIVHPLAETASIPEPVNLEDIDLTNISFLTYALKKIPSDNSESERPIITVKSISVWTIGLYIIICLALCILTFYYTYNRLKVYFRSSASTKENFELKEEGVKSHGSSHTDDAIFG